MVSDREVIALRGCFGLFLELLLLLTVSLSAFTCVQENRIPALVSLQKKHMDAWARLKSVQTTPKTRQTNTPMLWVELAYDAHALHLAGPEAGALHRVSCVWQQPVGSYPTMTKCWCVDPSVTAVDLSAVATWLLTSLWIVVVWSSTLGQQQSKTVEIATRWKGARWFDSTYDLTTANSFVDRKLHKLFTPIETSVVQFKCAWKRT